MTRLLDCPPSPEALADEKEAEKIVEETE